MADFIVSKGSVDPEGAKTNYYFKYPKTIQDINGDDVVVVDRVETTTLEQLEAQKADIQAKIDEITKL